MTEVISQALKKSNPQRIRFEAIEKLSSIHRLESLIALVQILLDTTEEPLVRFQAQKAIQQFVKYARISN